MDKRMALVTGASRGIGGTVATALAASGCRFLMNYRQRQQQAEEALARIERDGGKLELSAFDLSEPAACERPVARCLKAHDRIDVLVNNAGIRHDALLVFMKPDQWVKVIATKLTGLHQRRSPQHQRWG